MVVLGMRRVKHVVAEMQSVVSAIGHQLPGVDAYADALSWRPRGQLPAPRAHQAPKATPYA